MNLWLYICMAIYAHKAYGNMHAVIHFNRSPGPATPRPAHKIRVFGSCTDACRAIYDILKMKGRLLAVTVSGADPGRLLRLLEDGHAKSKYFIRTVGYAQ